MKRVFIFICCLLINVVSPAVRNTYQGWKLYRLWLESDEIVETMALLNENNLNIDFWTTLREPGQPVDVAVAEIAHPSFENILQKIHITHRTELEHVDWALNKERKEMKEVRDVEEGQINFSKYHRYKTIVSYLDNLAKTYEQTVKVRTIGNTAEGRDIKVVKISSGSDTIKPAILIDAGLSPREWIGPAQALYIIKELVENSANRRLIEEVDWFIIPLANPDGYEYTHTIQRLWKKNRSKNSAQYGTFINRNFDVNWGKNVSSTHGDEWNYQGSEPFSETESIAIKNFIEENSDNIQLYLSLHSFGPTILYPFAYTTEIPENIKLYRWLGKKVSAAIAEKSEVTYRVRSSCGTLFVYSGTSVDWTVKHTRIPLAYTIELPSPGYKGFDFPTNEIETVVNVIIPGIEVFHDYVKTNFYNPDDIDISAIEQEEGYSDRRNTTIEEETRKVDHTFSESSENYDDDVDEIAAEEDEIDVPEDTSSEEVMSVESDSDVEEFETGEDENDSVEEQESHQLPNKDGVDRNEDEDENQSKYKKDERNKAKEDELLDSEQEEDEYYIEEDDFYLQEDDWSDFRDEL